MSKENDELHKQIKLNFYRDMWIFCSFDRHRLWQKHSRELSLSIAQIAEAPSHTMR